MIDDEFNPKLPAELDPELLLSALAQGYFPMAEDAESLDLGWYRPDPRAILPLDEGFRVRRSLAKALRQQRFDIRFDSDFAAVIDACAEPRVTSDDQPDAAAGTWINPTIRQAYLGLAELGFGHSVEAYLDDQRVGGLYGVSLGGAFLGESMFSRCAFASQACLVALVEHLRRQNFLLLDVQFVNPHLEQFGAVEIPDLEYQRRLKAALSLGPCW